MPSYRGELGLPNQHAITATHQGRILTQRCRGAGAVLRTPRRGAAMRRARFVRRRPRRRRRAGSQRQESSFSIQIGALRRALVACACCSVSKALGQPFRAFCLRRQTLGTEVVEVWC